MSTPGSMAREAKKVKHMLELYIALSYAPNSYVVQTHVHYRNSVQVENGVMTKRAKGVSYWMCKQCSYTTRHRGHLNQHMTVHSGQRPFECHLCPMAFSRRATLANHLQLHERDRTFTCRFCPATFNVKSALDQHVNVHLTS
nr:zinc finger protein 776-like [Dermacentor andersoni]